MFSGAAIRDLQERAARKASREHKTPFIVWPGDVEKWVARHAAGTLRLPFPNIGTHRPKGWKPTGRTLFVDKTGWGMEGATPSSRKGSSSSCSASSVQAAAPALRRRGD